MEEVIRSKRHDIRRIEPLLRSISLFRPSGRFTLNQDVWRGSRHKCQMGSGGHGLSHFGCPYCAGYTAPSGYLPHWELVDSLADEFFIYLGYRVS